MFWFKKNKKEKISKECWNLNYSFILWLKERLPVYLEEAGKAINLEFHKFNFRGEEYTQLQLINKMIESVNYLTEDEKYFNWSQESGEKTEELLEIFKLVFSSLWW